MQAFDHRYYTFVSAALILLVGGLAVWLALRGLWLEAAALAGTAAMGLFFMFARDRLPEIFTLLFLIAGAANSAGYILNLWHQPMWFDEVAHAYTGFAGCAAIGWYLMAGTALSPRDRAMHFVLAVAGIGLVLGIAWEVFEWLVGIINGWADTLIDIVMDVIGAVAAGLFCVWAAGKMGASDNPEEDPASARDS